MGVVIFFIGGANMVKNFNKRLCCALCALISLFSASQRTESISFRDICRSSAKGTATVFRHGTSWIATVLSVVSMVYLFRVNPTKKEKIGFCALYTGLAAWGILNTCDMIYEYKESKSDKNEKPTSNNHGEFDTAKAQNKKDSPYLQ